MEEAMFRFSRLTVIVDLKAKTATLVPRSIYSSNQPVRLSLDELERVIQASAGGRRLGKDN